MSNKKEQSQLSHLSGNGAAWVGVPSVGYDIPLPNGCWKCIGCGKILSPRRRWNQCADCDTREPEER